MNKLSLRGILVCLALAVALSMTASPTAATPATGDDPGNPVHQYNSTLATTLFRSVFNGGDTGAIDELISPNAVIHTPYGEFVGPEGLQEYLDIVRRGYPDAWFEITSVDVYGDTVVIQWVMTASRYLIGPTSGPIAVQVSSPNQTTITVADGQVADLIQAQYETAITPATGVTSILGPHDLTE